LLEILLESEVPNQQTLVAFVRQRMLEGWTDQANETLRVRQTGEEFQLGVRNLNLQDNLALWCHTQVLCNLSIREM